MKGCSCEKCFLKLPATVSIFLILEKRVQDHKSRKNKEM